MRILQELGYIRRTFVVGEFLTLLYSTTKVRTTMIYWLIPYLIAYNASDAGNWRYGPEHVFKAEVRTIATMNNSSKIHANVDMYLTCRPMNSSVIQCRSESATFDNWRIDADGTSSLESHSPRPYEIGNIVFQIDFNEDGISNLRLINSEGKFWLYMFRAIFDTVHWGIDMSGKKYGRYVSTEKSMIGSCETTFHIGSKASSKEEIKVESAIDGYRFDVPAFHGRTGNEPIVIEKNRNIDRCSEKTLYLFGSTEDKMLEIKHGLSKNTQVTSSRSRIYLGRNIFSGYTRYTGTVDVSSSQVTTMRSVMNIDESIHLSLETIRPAKTAIRQRRNLVHA